MARYSVALYALYLKERETEKFATLDILEGRIDLFTLIKDFCRQQKTLGRQKDENLQRTSKLESFCVNEEKRTVYGMYEKGDFGTRQRIYDVNTDKETHDKSKSESMPEPFYFSVTIPEGETRAYLAFQRISNRSVQSEFIKDLQESLKPLRDKHFKPMIGNALSPRLIRELVEGGRIGEIKVIARQIPQDFIRLDTEGFRDVEGTVELSVKGRRGLPINDQIMRLFNTRGMSVSDIAVFQDMNFEYDEMKIQVTRDGRDITVDLSDLNKIRPYYVIGEGIEKDDDGNPSLEALHNFAMELVDNFREETDEELELE